MSEREIRTVASVIEVREDGDKPNVLSGYAALFNTETVIGGMFREAIAPGAFRDAVGRDDVRALFNHDPNIVLGRTGSGTVRLSEDALGLRYEVDLPDTQAARDLMVSVRRGDISQSSFAFGIAKREDAEWKQAATRGELPLRTIKRAQLFDVSPVTYPAYEQTSVSARDEAKAAADVVEIPAPRPDYAPRLTWIQKALSTLK
jgi:HK97 family phage prohead protease